MNLDSPKPEKKLFTFYWDSMVVELGKRKNLAPSHLLQFKVLCDAYCQYDKLFDIVEEEGHVITRMTSQGESIITNPHLIQLNKTVGQIKDYSRTLGLILVKEDVDEDPEEGPEDDWS